MSTIRGQRVFLSAVKEGNVYRLERFRMPIRDLDNYAEDAVKQRCDPAGTVKVDFGGAVGVRTVDAYKMRVAPYRYLLVDATPRFEGEDEGAYDE